MFNSYLYYCVTFKVERYDLSKDDLLVATQIMTNRHTFMCQTYLRSISQKGSWILVRTM